MTFQNKDRRNAKPAETIYFFYFPPSRLKYHQKHSLAPWYINVLPSGFLCVILSMFPAADSLSRSLHCQRVHGGIIYPVPLYPHGLNKIAPGSVTSRTLRAASFSLSFLGRCFAKRTRRTPCRLQCNCCNFFSRLSSIYSERKKKSVRFLSTHEFGQNV